MPRLREKPLDILASMIVEGKKVVFITGAGLSAASGIPTFRGDSDSIWVQKATSWGMKRAFLRDPLIWYNTFWFPYFPMKFTRMKANGGHEALAQLANLSPQVTIVTQNIDTLSQQTRQAWNHAEQLVEVHGRMGIYHCSGGEGDAEGGGHCEMATETFMTTEELWGKEIAKAIDDPETGASVQVSEVPLCPRCGKWPMMPLAMMFDEDYTSHALYQFDRAMNWFEQADAVAFVGTSFSVHITSLAMQQARAREVPVFNFNLAGSLKGGRRFSVYNVLGRAEDTLGQVVQIVTQKLAPETKPPASADVEGKPCPPAAPTPPTVAGPSSHHVGASSSSTPADNAAAHWGTRDVKPPSFELTPRLPEPLPLERVCVDLNPAYGRRLHPQPDVEEGVEVLWADVVTKVPGTFNGLKFRLASAVLCTSGASGADPEAREKRARTAETLLLRVWLTDYKTFRGTNWSPRVAQLQHDGQRDHGDTDAYLAQKIGVSAVVVTSDRHVILVQRSGHVSEGQGLFDVPGGHPEPSRLGVQTLAGEGGMPPQLTPEAVCREIFDSATTEVCDEVNLPREALQPPLLLGIVRQLVSGGCPSLAFLIGAPGLSSHDVMAAYAAGPREAFETTRLICVPIAELAAGGLPGPMTPSAEGSVHLYLSMAGGERG